MNLKNIILVCTGLASSVALLVTTAACSSVSLPVTSSTIPPTTTFTATTASPTTSAPATASRRGPNGTFGTLAAINGDTLTLTTSQGQSTVNVSSSTTIEKTVSGTIADLGQGDYVTISGTTDSTGNIDAASIMVRAQAQTSQFFPPTGTTTGNGGNFTRPNGDSPGGGLGGQFTIGTINVIDGNSFTVTTAQGQVTVNVGTDTVIQQTVSGALSDLSIGDSLSVIGLTDSNSDIDATSISIRPQGQGFPGTQPTTTTN